MDTRKAHTVSYNELCHHLWDSLEPSAHTLLCNPFGSTTQWNASLAMSAAECVCTPRIICSGHAVNICPATVESHALYLPVFMVLHILHTTSPTGSGFSLVQHTSHIKIKTHFILQSLPWFQQTTYIFNLTYL